MPIEIERKFLVNHEKWDNVVKPTGHNYRQGYLVAEAGIGLAPGDAFGPEGRGWLRWCFASKDVNRLAEGVRRLRQWLESNRAA